MPGSSGESTGPNGNSGEIASMRGLAWRLNAIATQADEAATAARTANQVRPRDRGAC